MLAFAKIIVLPFPKILRRFTLFGLRQRGSHSVVEHFKNSNMDVQVLPALTDNYMYLIVDKVTKNAAVVDPVEPTKVLEVVNKMGVYLTTVLTTHHHWDHAGGNVQLAELSPNLVVYGGDDRIGALTYKVDHGTNFRIGNLLVNCLYTPCHTTGHICYYVTAPDSPDCGAIFTGDTLFLGGCGRFFEGTAEQMYSALINVLSALPDSTKVFCGHEYTLSNLKFASKIEPENEVLQQKIAWCTERRKANKPTVPSTIGEEKQYNPFMRVIVNTVMQYAGATNPIDTMKTIRLEKDNFKG